MPRSILTAFVYLGCCLCPAFSASAAKPVGEPMVYKTVDDRDLTLYVTKPGDWQATDTRPAIVFYHGGGWVGGAPGQFTEHAKYLASRGMVAIQVQYRLLDRNSDDPPTICVQDAKSAMRWVRGRASALGIDADRIASAGGSAGGHLAAFVGMVDGIDDPKDDTTVSAKSNAMVLFNPVFNNVRVNGDISVWEAATRNSRRPTILHQMIPRQSYCLDPSMPWCPSAPRRRSSERWRKPESHVN